MCRGGGHDPAAASHRLHVAREVPGPIESDHPVALAARGGATLYADCTADTFRSLARSPEQLSFIEACARDR